MAVSERVASGGGNGGVQGCAQPHRDVVPFPAANREGAIRALTETLFTTHGPSADAAFRQAIADLRGELVGWGLGTLAIEDQLRSFANAVLSRVHERQMSAYEAGTA